MGTEVSSANEWIELYNDSSNSVDLSGWHIEAEDGSPNILLTGSVAPNGYYLIERTDDTTVPNISADIVAAFGNGLSNDGGETLRLNDASNVIVDTVIGGASWVNIGGNSTTKQTAQRLPAGSNSWITATATPRAANASSGEVEGASTVPQENTASSDAAVNSSSSSAGGTTKSAYPTPIYPRKEMTVIAGADQRVFTGFPLSFSGRALGLYDESLPYATHRWNFGDGTIAEGSDVSHVYRFFGEYTVTLEAFYGSLKNSDRIIVMVSDPDIVITRMATGTAGFIEISNRSGREIDLAGWSLLMQIPLATSSTKFFFAPNTILLSGKSVRFPNMVTQLGNTTGVIQLRTPTGTLVHAYGDTRPTLSVVGAVAGAMTIKQPEEIFTSPKISQEINIPPSPKLFAVVDTQRIASGEAMPSASSTAATVLWERGVVPAPGQFSSEMQWFFVFMGFLLIALAGFIIVRSRVDQATIADEYAIIEDIIESEADLVRKSQKILVE
jgi:hypothetical protein